MMTCKAELFREFDAATREILLACGIRSAKALIDGCGTQAKREALAQKTGIPEATLLKLANMAALRRVTGICPEHSQLLAAVGVDSIARMASRNGCNLALALATANATTGFCHRVPATVTVWKWIDRARSAPRLIEE